MQFKRVRIQGRAIVLAFDICSSSSVIEQLTTRGSIQQYQSLLTSLKHYMADAQKTLLFDPYKFMGDGWILLFPAEITQGVALLQFMKGMCAHFKERFAVLLKYLDSAPDVKGLTFGADVGMVHRSTMFQQPEYVGYPINVACRLQSAIKDKDESPGYKALVTGELFAEFLAPAAEHYVQQVKRSLRNIHNDKPFHCRKIHLLKKKPIPDSFR